MTLAFTVYGVAQPKGSMRAFTPRGMQFPIVTASNRNVRSWQQLVAEGANRAIGALPDGDRGILTGPVRLTVAFYLPRPKRLRRGVHHAHVTKPDLDKLARSVSDALSQIVYHDDSQIVEALLGKFYAAVNERPRVDVRVEPTIGIALLEVAPAPLPLFEHRA